MRDVKAEIPYLRALVRRNASRWDRSTVIAGAKDVLDLGVLDLEVLARIRDGVDGPARLSALLGGDQSPDEDDPLTLLP
jgi:hypothetical protein